MLGLHRSGDEEVAIWEVVGIFDDIPESRVLDEEIVEGFVNTGIEAREMIFIIFHRFFGAPTVCES